MAAMPSMHPACGSCAADPGTRGRAVRVAPAVVPAPLTCPTRMPDSGWYCPSPALFVDGNSSGWGAGPVRKSAGSSYRADLFRAAASFFSLLVALRSFASISRSHATGTMKRVRKVAVARPVTKVEAMVPHTSE